MECYITYCVKGFLAFNSENELISEKLFPETEILNRLADIDDKKIVKEETEIIEEVSKDYDEIIIESNKRKSDYDNEKITIKNPNPAGEYLRSNYEEFGLDSQEITEIYRNLAIYKIKKESASEDKHLIQAINSIDEIDESISKLIERIREWYALYFPEMDIIKNNETYIKLISQNKTKEEILKAKPDAFPTDIIDIDDDINPKDLEIMNNYANSISEMQQTRKDLEDYVDLESEKETLMECGFWAETDEYIQTSIKKFVDESDWHYALRNGDDEIEDIEADEDAEECCKNKDAEVAIIVGRQNDVVKAKKVSVVLSRLKISHDIKVVCPIRSTKKFTNYVKSMKNAKVFIGISSNSSQVTGGIVGLTDRPVIGVPCTNENGDDYMLTTVSMPPGAPVATVGINNGSNAAVLAAEILSINNPNIVQLLDKLKDKKITL